MSKLNILIVDDHNLFREGLKLLLSTSRLTGIIEEASDGLSFLEKLQTFLPDIVFMDIEMPGMDGITATRKALEAYPGLNIIALSMYSDESYYTHMIDAGARGFMLKDSGFDEVEQALVEVTAGRSFFSHEILSEIVRNINKIRSIKQNYDLTEREIEVLFHICKGLSNQEIADRLNISKRTVDKHRENLLVKTDSKNTASLVIYAIKHGIVEI